MTQRGSIPALLFQAWALNPGSSLSFVDFTVAGLGDCPNWQISTLSVNSLGQGSKSRVCPASWPGQSSGHCPGPPWQATLPGCWPRPTLFPLRAAVFCPTSALLCCPVLVANVSPRQSPAPVPPPPGGLISPTHRVNTWALFLPRGPGARSGLWHGHRSHKGAGGSHRGALDH